ncbi:MAG: hypothetical protein EOP88_08085 [Verrucomicrobiaceae bacterium]|nr:MAG: hypothetical protein EOP88_08085 [Verrucomicrobiaceae bacterium]
MKIPRIKSFFLACALSAGSADAAIIAITNGGFETGSVGSSTIAGWTTTAGATGFWLTNVAGSVTDPTSPHGGALYLSANRLSGAAASQPTSSTLSQTVSLSAASVEIASGTGVVDLSFWYNDNDPLDGGQVNVTFLDGSAAVIGATLSLGNAAADGTAIPGTTAGVWALRTLTGAVPVGAVSARIDLITNRYGGSATNVAFDDFTMTVIPEPSAALLGALAPVGLLLRRRRN